MSLLHHVILPPSTSIASNEVFWNVLRRLEHIVCWCVAVPAHEVPICYRLCPYDAHAIDCVLGRHIREYFYGSLSSGLVALVASFVDWLVFRDLEYLLCKFQGWPQCTSADWDRTLDCMFINRDCRRWYFDRELVPDVPKILFWEHQLVVRLRRQTFIGRCCHWWPVEIDVLYGGKRQ